MTRRDVRPRRGLRPRLPGLRRASARAAGRGARAIWRDGVRISLGLGRGTGAKIAPWLLIGLALVPIVVLVVIAAFLGPRRATRTTSSCRRTPSTTTGRSCRSGSSPRSSRRSSSAPTAATACSRSTRRGRSRPLDYVGCALGGVPHRVAGRGVASRGDPLRLERARRGEAGVVARRQLGRRAALPRRRA